MYTGTYNSAVPRSAKGFVDLLTEKEVSVQLPLEELDILLED